MESITSTRYEIRRATLADTAELVRMQIALQDSTEDVRRNLLHLSRANLDKLYEYYRTQVHDEQTRLLIAEIAGSSQAVGMGTGKIWLHADCVPTRSGEMIDLWIDPMHRRRGLARRIIARLLQFFKGNGIDFLSVNYVDGNLCGEDLWRGLGFEPVLVTATAERENAEQALGARPRQAAPLACRSVPPRKAPIHTPLMPAV